MWVSWWRKAWLRSSVAASLAEEALGDHHAVPSAHRLQCVDDPGLFLTLGLFALQGRRRALPGRAELLMLPRSALQRANCSSRIQADQLYVCFIFFLMRQREVCAISCYSRFRGFNSRLGVLWEFAGTVLICLVFLGGQTAVLRGKVINSRLDGKNREWQRYQQVGLRRSAARGSHALSVSRSIG